MFNEKKRARENITLFTEENIKHILQTVNNQIKDFTTDKENL
jgi:hypothetical protein